MRKENFEIQRICTNCGESQEDILEMDRDCEHCDASFEEIAIHNPKRQRFTCCNCDREFVYGEEIYRDDDGKCYCTDYH